MRKATPCRGHSGRGQPRQGEAVRTAVLACPMGEPSLGRSGGLRAGAGRGLASTGGGGGDGTRPWGLALLACGGAYWPLTLEPSAMTIGGGGGMAAWAPKPDPRPHPHLRRKKKLIKGARNWRSV